MLTCTSRRRNRKNETFFFCRSLCRVSASHFILLALNADKYISYVAPRSGAVERDFDKLTHGVENGFIWDIINPGSDELPVEDGLSKESTSEVGVSDGSAHN